MEPFKKRFTPRPESVTVTEQQSEENYTWKIDPTPVAKDGCLERIPTSEQMFRELNPLGIVLLSICCILAVLTLGIYLEEVVFTIRFFRKQYRIRKVLTLLSIYPVVSFCSLMALIVPKSSTITDLVAAVYLSHCIYQFVNLLLDYYGGINIMLIALSEYKYQLRSPPCCCCCFCLPTVPTSRKNFNRIRALVLQAAILRPIIMFIAAVLWTNGTYSPGQLDPTTAYTYISITNTISSMFSMYGCVQLLMVCRPTLEAFHIRAKLLLLQLVVICTGVLSFVCSILVKYGAFPCIPPFSSDARGERLYNTLIVILMCLCAVIARKYYRREEEGSRIYKLSDGPHFEHNEDRALTNFPHSNSNQRVLDKVVIKPPPRDQNVSSA